MVRTPRFKAWFGDWEQSNQSPVKAIILTGSEIGGQTPKEARTDAKKFVGNLIRALLEKTGTDTLLNERTGFKIRLLEKGVTHGFQHKGAEHVKAVAAIKQLIEGSAKIATRAHEPLSDDSSKVHTLVAPLSIDGDWFAVKLTVKESWDGKMRLYDHQALRMNKPDGISESTPESTGSIHRPASGSVVTIGHLLSAFKGEPCPT